jgi:diacylglycerol kinase (ATP)
VRPVSGAEVLWTVLAVLAVVLVTVGLFAARRSRSGRPGRRGEPRSAPEPFATEPADRPLAAVVVNPTKYSDTGPLRETVGRICAEAGWAEPLWLETTPEEHGVTQTREALDRGADVVIACGGDGTVRAVGEAMAGTGTAMGLLPAGTGNLLARNLAVDLTDVEGSLRAALDGDDRPLDVGWAEVTDAEGRVRPEQAFLVMAGMGFDAVIMADAPEVLKARVGPLAYVVSGLRHLRGRQARVQISVDDATPVQRRVRTVVVGNVGTLLGGLMLMPDAEVDDGWLDGVTIAPTGLVGWMAVAVRVATRTRRGHSRVEHWRGQNITIAADRPEQAQIDGDPIGEAVQLRLRVEPRALLLRVPAGTPSRA